MSTLNIPMVKYFLQSYYRLNYNLPKYVRLYLYFEENNPERPYVSNRLERVEALAILIQVTCDNINHHYSNISEQVFTTIQ